MKKVINQLVCQHLEKLSRVAIEQHQDIIRKFINNRNGIYALYHNNKCVYVGLATDLRTRLYKHLTDKHANSWNKFSVYLTIGNDKLKELESLVIRIALPEDNRQHTKCGKFKHSEDLKKKFKKMFRDKNKEILRRIFEDPNASNKLEKPAQKYNGKKPILSKYEEVTKLRLKFKNKMIYARVTKNGTIIIKKRKFTSPSQAAKWIVKYSVDGWHIWQYERAPGEWIYINELRK